MQYAGTLVFGPRTVSLDTGTDLVPLAELFDVLRPDPRDSGQVHVRLTIEQTATQTA